MEVRPTFEHAREFVIASVGVVIRSASREMISFVVLLVESHAKIA